MGLRAWAARNVLLRLQASVDTPRPSVATVVASGKEFVLAPMPTHMLPRSLSTGVVRGLNILKTGQDPEEMKDEDVPDWLRALGQRGAGPTLQELERQGELSLEEHQLLKKLRNRQRITRANALAAK